jgi:hypothetical protein
MSYEQQYPEVEEFVDWNNPEPSDPQKSKANSGSLGMSLEPKGGIFSNRGRLRADLYTAFDKLPFNPNDHLRFGRIWDQPSDEQKWMAEILGIKDPKKLNVYGSPESYFLTRAVQDWNAKKAGMSMTFFEPPDPRMNDDLMKYVIDAEGDVPENHKWDYGGSTNYGIS